VVIAPCGRAPDQILTFDGAFLTAGKLCLATSGQHIGARLVFVTCSGRKHQLWEFGTGGTIATIQQVACITEVNGIVQLGNCRTTSSNRGNQWIFVPGAKPAQTVG
jgi:hypothetical protein